MKRFILLSAFLLLAAMPVSIAQSLRTVEGRVVNDDGVPIEGADIIVKNYNQTFTSDSYGNFSIQVPYGYNYISATHLDYTSATAEIDGSYVILKLKYDAAGVKSREEARLKAQQDSIKAANNAAALAAVAAAKAEKERIAAEKKAEKEAEAKAQAETAARKKAEKEAEARVQAEAAAREKAEIAAERARKKAEIKAKEDAYNEKFKNKGFAHSIDLSCVYELSRGTILYKYSGYRSYGNLFPLQLNYTLSYKFNRFVSVGIGVGALYNVKSITIVNDEFEYPNGKFKEQRLDVPASLNLKVNLCRTKVRPYISLSGGYYLLSHTLMGEGGLGCEIRYARRGAFRIQASTSLVPWPNISMSSVSKYTPTINPGIKVGFDF